MKRIGIAHSHLLVDMENAKLYPVAERMLLSRRKAIAKLLLALFVLLWVLALFLIKIYGV